jgi:DNA-binding MarR family transcriptional regulator
VGMSYDVGVAGTAASPEMETDTPTVSDTADPPLPGVLYQVSRLYRQAIGERLKNEQWLVDVGFRPPCISAIMTIARHQPLSQRELSSHMGVDPSDLVNVMDILERAGFVLRERDPDDRRRHLLTVTRSGRRAVERLGTLLQEIDDDVLSPLSAHQRHVLRRLLDGVVAHHLD